MKTTKKALKTFKFWFKVMKEVKAMEDKEHFKEYKQAIKTFKKISKNKPV